MLKSSSDNRTIKETGFTGPSVFLSVNVPGPVYFAVSVLWLHYQFIGTLFCCAVLWLHHQLIGTLFLCVLLWLHYHFIVAHHDLSTHIYQDHFRWKNYIRPPTSAVTLNPGRKTECCNTTTKHKEAARVNHMCILWDTLCMIVCPFYLTRFRCWWQISSWLLTCGEVL